MEKVSEWYCEDTMDYMKLYLDKENKRYYGAGNDFDFERKSKSEAEDQLKKWNYKQIW